MSPTSSVARCGCRSPAGSWSRIRVAPSSGSRRAASRSDSWRPLPYSRPASNCFPASTIAPAGSRRFSTSFSGSWSRKTSIPLDAAEATKRRAKSPPTGRDPTRKRPRTASASGVFVRAFRARIRSHGLSTPRRTAESKTPPPDTSRYAKPAPSRSSARRSRSAVGMSPASGSWLSTRIVVSTRRGIGPGPHRRRLRALYVRLLGSLDVALLARVDLELVAHVHEERHLDDGAGLERRRLCHVADGVALHARLRVGHLEHHRCGEIDAGRRAADEQHLPRRRGLHERQRVLHRLERQR